MDIDTLTLMTNFGHELEVGRDHTIAQVASKLIDKALEGDTTCMMFFLRSQGGWKETTRNELSGPNGAPIQTEAVTIDGKNLTDDQRATLRHALQIAIHGKITDG